MRLIPLHRLVPALLALGLLSPTYGAEAEQGGRRRVATLFGEPIYADRPDRISGQICGALKDRYVKEHGLEPTDAELRPFVELMRRQRRRSVEEWERRLAEDTAKLASDAPLSDRERRSLRESVDRLKRFLAREDAEWVKRLRADAVSRAIQDARDAAGLRQAARWFVGNWKFNKSLHERYGGTVIWQQAGIEALGATRLWLKEHEAKGDFTIEAPELRRRFWEYYGDAVERSHRGVIQDKEPFKRPPWSDDEGGREANDGNP